MWVPPWFCDLDSVDICPVFQSLGIHPSFPVIHKVGNVDNFVLSKFASK